MPLPDIVDRQTRSRMMSGIRGRDTRPELLVRKGLFGRGFRYRLHVPDLPGKPDLVFPKYSAVIFVNGCFWHGHDCHLFRMPSTRPEFWRKKIEGNIARDKATKQRLGDMGWRQMTIWECAVKGRTRLPLEDVLDRTAMWLAGDRATSEMRGAA